MSATASPFSLRTFFTPGTAAGSNEQVWLSLVGGFFGRVGGGAITEFTDTTVRFQGHVSFQWVGGHVDKDVDVRLLFAPMGMAGAVKVVVNGSASAGDFHVGGDGRLVVERLQLGQYTFRLTIYPIRDGGGETAIDASLSGGIGASVHLHPVASAAEAGVALAAEAGAV